MYFAKHKLVRGFLRMFASLREPLEPLTRPITYHLSPITYCLLPIAYCLSPIAYRLSPKNDSRDGGSVEPSSPKYSPCLSFTAFAVRLVNSRESLFRLLTTPIKFRGLWGTRLATAGLLQRYSLAGLYHRCRLSRFCLLRSRSRRCRRLRIDRRWILLEVRW